MKEAEDADDLESGVGMHMLHQLVWAPDWAFAVLAVIACNACR